ncbi:uncharacterized protein LOC130928817 [Corythoichthys intestinalis]|uniref:uncharacterized protein LOC130928817 n=1 Tax=Corythoichthys intestinalis TaxID=161448 RepID=UPI0025A5134C|nr:uncharacterized protein LOC130928817 [Corythoichthys intestinalis]XP_057711563.1 uncharacterized protein LOC130928817 [Corythoichthys intestinalis]XP_057711564.1 uncharacterized protein LOC130928817 [Corythoichthys intestinalis]
MSKTQRTAYVAAFKLQAIDLAIVKGNRSAAHELGVNESMIRRWRKQHEALSCCKKTTKAFRGKKRRVKPAHEMENDPNERANDPRSSKVWKSRVEHVLKERESTAEEPMLCEFTENVKKNQIVKLELQAPENTECSGDSSGFGTKEIKQEEESVEVDTLTECSFCIQRAAEVSHLVEENLRLRRELDAFKMPDGFFQNNDGKVQYYTGMPNLASFMTFFCFLLPLMPAQESRLSPFQVLLLTFMRLRLDLPIQHLAHIFSISTSTANATFRETVSFLYTNLRPSITWPNQNTLQKTTPVQFVEAFGGKAVAIIDCLRVSIQKPSTCNGRQKVSGGHVTYLIALSLGGFVGFVSHACNGFITTKNMLEKSGFLCKLSPGDVVLARGLEGDKSAGLFYAEVDESTFVKKNFGDTTHLSAHVETMLGNMHRKYQLLKTYVSPDLTQRCDGEAVTMLDKIVTVCYALENHCVTVV